MAEQSTVKEQPAERRTADHQAATGQHELSLAAGMAAMPQALLALQRAAGNEAVTQLIVQRAVLDPMPPDPGMAKLAADQAAEKARQHKEVDPIIESFPPNVQSQIPLEDRWTFMTMMRGYLGPDPATQKHFTSIVDAHRVIPQASVWLHQTAVDRLQAIHDQVGSFFPYTDVGQDLRGRYHERESKSRMAHPMGYAVDFRPYENPMITDKQLTRLLELVGKGSAHAELGLAPTERRQLIGKIGSGEALTPEDEGKADALFAQLNSEFDRLSKASEKFKASVNRSQLADLRSEYFGTFKAHTQILKKTVARLQELDKQKHLSDAETAEQSNLVAVQDFITQSQAGFRRRVADAIAPWTKAVQDALSLNDQEIVMRAPIVFRSAPTPEQYALMKRAFKQLRDVEKSNRDKAKDPAERAQAQQAYVEADHGYNQAVDVGDLVDDRVFLNGLITRLGDLTFIFGASPDADVKNPALAQIAEKGFFTPDAERPPGMQGQPDMKKEGFNRAFMLLMVKHGFDLGVSWAGFTDPMHFELVQGVDSLREPGQPEKAAAPAAQPAAAPVQRAPLEPGALHIQRDDGHVPAAPVKTTDLDENAHAIIKAAQAETPGIEERAVNAVWAIIDTYYADRKDMVSKVKYDAEETGLKTTARGHGPKVMGLISVGHDFIVHTKGQHFARHVLQVAHELEHIQQHRDGMGGAGRKHEREFLAFYHEATATEVPHTGRMDPEMRIKLLNEAINNYNALSAEDQKRYADQYKDVVAHKASEEKAGGKGTTAAPAAVQRAALVAPATVPTKAEGDGAVIEAATGVLNRLGDWQLPTVPAGLPKDEAELIWDLWTAASGETGRSGFKQASAPAAVRLDALSRGYAGMQPIVNRYQQSQPLEAASVVPAFNGRFETAQYWLFQLEAHEKANPTREEQAIVNPRVRADVGLGIASAVKLQEIFSTLGEVADARGEVYEKELEEAIKKAENDELLPKGAGAAAIFPHLGGLCDGIVAILQASDPEEREELLKATKGNWAVRGEGIVDALQWTTSALRGLVSAAALGTAALARLQKMTNEAAACLAVSSKVVEGFGTFASGLQIVHGVLVVANAKTDAERAEGAVEATAGTLGLAGASGLAIGIEGTWMFSKYLFNEVGAGEKGIIYGSVNDSLHQIRQSGEILAGKFLYYQKLGQLVRATSDPARLNAYGDLQDTAGADLVGQIGDAWTIAMNDNHRAIVNHFKPLIPVVANLKAVEQSPGDAAPKLLDSMVQLFENTEPLYQDAVKEWDEKQSGHHL